MTTACPSRAPSTHPFGPCRFNAGHAGDHESDYRFGVPMGWTDADWEWVESRARIEPNFPFYLLSEEYNTR